MPGNSARAGRVARIARQCVHARESLLPHQRFGRVEEVDDERDGDDEADAEDEAKGRRPEAPEGAEPDDECQSQEEGSRADRSRTLACLLVVHRRQF